MDYHAWYSHGLAWHQYGQIAAYSPITRSLQGSIWRLVQLGFLPLCFTSLKSVTSFLLVNDDDLASLPVLQTRWTGSAEEEVVWNDRPVLSITETWTLLELPRNPSSLWETDNLLFLSCKGVWGSIFTELTAAQPKLWFLVGRKNMRKVIESRSQVNLLP